MDVVLETHGPSRQTKEFDSAAMEIFSTRFTKAWFSRVFHRLDLIFAAGRFDQRGNCVPRFSFVKAGVH